MGRKLGTAGARGEKGSREDAYRFAESVTVELLISTHLSSTCDLFNLLHPTKGTVKICEEPSVSGVLFLGRPI